MGTILALWNIAKWVRKQRKEMEKNAEAYLTDERALAWRREAEEIFAALAEGYKWTQGPAGGVKRLPKVIQWFFNRTEADNHLGRFGQKFLKSHNLDVYRTH